MSDDPTYRPEQMQAMNEFAAALDKDAAPATPVPEAPKMKRATSRLLEANKKFMASHAGLVPKPTKAERKEKELKAKAKQDLANRFRQCRRFLAESRFDDADAYALKHGFTVEEARQRSWDHGASLPTRPAPVPALAAVEDPGPVDYMNGWPMRSRATVIAFCKNPRLVVVELSDGREASMIRERKDWRLGSEIKVKLVEAQADPIYEWLPNG